MDFNWWPHMNGFWMFPLLCLFVMIIMMVVCSGTWARFGHPDKDRHHRESARDILERRYASGEIGKEEFDEVRRQLTA